MKRKAIVASCLSVLVGVAWASLGLAHEGDEGAADQTVQGEVVDVTCYLSHGESGLGQGHAGCAKKCLLSGLPVAIKVGDKLYLAVSADHQPMNAQLASLAGQQVKATGHVMERDGQTLIAIERVEAVQ